AKRRKPVDRCSVSVTCSTIWSDRASALFDINLANAFLLTNFLHVVSNQIGQTNALRDRFNDDQRRGGVRSIQLNVLDSTKPVEKRLSLFDVLDPIKLERVGRFAQNSFDGF